jgi:hypothetical protein
MTCGVNMTIHPEEKTMNKGKRALKQTTIPYDASPLVNSLLKQNSAG